MPVNLNELFELLDEQVIAQVVSIKHDRAREQYPLENITIDSFQDFENEIVLYYQYHFSETIGNSDIIMAPEAAYSYARQIIEGHFRRHGELNPLEGAYRIARTGTNGGLRYIIDIIAGSLKRSQEMQYTEYIIDSYIDPVDYDAHIELMREYLQRYRDYIPADMRLKSPELLPVEYKQLIKLHVDIVNRIRNTMARY